MVQRSVTMRQDINAPALIARKHFLRFRSEKPARKLPAHTPVSGRGRATKVVSIRYFLKADFSCSSKAVLMLYFDLTAFAIKPVVLDLILRVTSIATSAGISEPINAKIKACHAGKAASPHIAPFIAKGMAILLSSVGIIASKITASQMHDEKLFARNSTTKFIFLSYSRGFVNMNGKKKAAEPLILHIEVVL